MCLLLIAVLLVLLQAITTIRVANPRRETEVASYELFFQVQRACGLQGRLGTVPANHPPKPPDPWRWTTAPIAQIVCSKIGGYPEAVFSIMCSNAILIYMWLYNLILKFNGFDFDHWIRLNYKPPPLFRSVVSYDKDNPPKPRKCQAPKPNSLLRYRLAAFAILNARLCEGALFCLKSNWDETSIMDWYETVFDGRLEPPSLAEERLTLEEVAKIRTKCQAIGLKQGRQLYHEVSKKAHREHNLLDNAQTVKPSPLITSTSNALTPPTTAASPTRERTPARLDDWARAPPLPPPPPQPPPLATQATDVGQSEVTSSCYPQRARAKREQLVPSMTGTSSDTPKRDLSALAAALALTPTVESL